MSVSTLITNYTRQLLIIAGCIVVLALGTIGYLGIPFGIDFTGGTLVEVVYDERPEKAPLEAELSTLELGGISLRETSGEAVRTGYILRTRSLAEDERQQVEEILTNAGVGAELGRYTSIGPVIGQELASKSIWAIGAIALIIVLYVAFAFRGVSKPVGSWMYGSITIFALIHDVLVPTALMSVLGIVMGAEADVLFVMALLAVLGYSVNDTIVVFDRVRENLTQNRTEHIKEIKEAGVERTETTYTLNRPFASLVGEAVDSTLLRSLNTSLTTVLALIALYVFGGEVTQTFSLMLIAGIVAGTYSSIFIAPAALIAFAERQTKKQS